ncbi:hypothetical protein ES702_02588 [subsurface metagenome]
MDINSAVAVAGSAGASPLTLLDLPDDLLLPIFAYLPLTAESLQSLRLVCKRINDLTHTKALYSEVARSQFPDISPLFFVELTEVNMVHSRALQHELDRFHTDIMLFAGSLGYDHFTAKSLEAVVKRGLALIWWLCHHAVESPNYVAAINPLCDLVEKGQLGLAALLAIKIALLCLFKGISARASEKMIQTSRANELVYQTPDDGEDWTRLFLAFESAVFWTKRDHRDETGRIGILKMHDKMYMRDAFSSMINPSSASTTNLRIYNCKNPISSSESWTILSSLLKEKALSCPNLNRLFWVNSESLTDIDINSRIMAAMGDGRLVDEVSKCLDLHEIGRSARLKGTYYGFPPLRHWSF